MKHTISILCLGLLLVTLPACYPHYGAPPGHARHHSYGFWPGWNSPAWHAPGHTRGIKPKYKSHPASRHHHHHH